ncbi:MAG: peptidylprolyl isomerase [Gammaproteobacteria bacterium]|nr:MAG: peptidylprolyl isomerase [Gammaproteobacteria bacterium]
MNITENAVVLFHYTLTDEDGVQLDSSADNAPLAYIHGHKNIIPGLEQAMEGKTEGDAMKVTVPAAEAYGEYQDHLVQDVPREAFQGIDEVKPGMRFEAQTPSGPVSVVVTAATDETVTVDGNHPLAGKDLTFDVKIETVREASEEELAHGHVHGEGGHDH